MSSDEWMPSCLVLGPGGFQGFYHIGVASFLETKGLLKNINKFSGVSVGAIVSYMLSIGYTSSEISRFGCEIGSLFDEIVKRESNDEIKPNTSIFKYIIEMAKQSYQQIGLVSSDPIRNKLIELTKNKLGIIPTYLEHYNATHKELTVVSVNRTKKQNEYFSRINTPNMDVITSLILSINIPGIFHIARYNGDIYVDGAFGDPYPISPYDDGNTDIIGVSIVKSFDPETIGGYMYGNVEYCMTTIRNYITTNASPRVKHIVIKSDTLDTTGIYITDIDKAQMIAKGWHEIRKLFSTSITICYK